VPEATVAAESEAADTGATPEESAKRDIDTSLPTARPSPLPASYHKGLNRLALSTF
jgi:hypothetical protein